MVVSDKLVIPPLDIEHFAEFHFKNIKWRLPIPRQRKIFVSEHQHLFHINRLEDVRKKITFPLPAHRKTVNDCIFLTRGSSTRSKGLNTYNFQENQLFFLPAYQITSHEFMSKDVEGYYLHFDSEIFPTFSLKKLTNFPCLQFWTNPTVSLPTEALKPILNVFERLQEIYLNLTEADFELVFWYLVTLLTEVNRFSQDDRKRATSAAAYLTQQYKNALVQYIYQMRTVREYADLLNVTPKHLNRCVKNTINRTAKELLKEMIALEAKSLR